MKRLRLVSSSSSGSTSTKTGFDQPLLQAMYVDREQPEQPGQRQLPGMTLPSLGSLMRMTYEEWDKWTRGSAVRRAGYGGMKRNVAVALGNWGAEEAIPVLVEALSDAEPLVRGHSAWALGRMGEGAPAELALAVAEALSACLCVEADAEVRDELALALCSLGGSTN
jgi:epoxyqueuosine reductase